MNKCRILIADDERLAREAIRLQLRGRDDIEIVSECSDGKETLDAIIRHRPDIAFLDIRMPNLSGMEVLEKLDPEYIPFVIFVTAYDDYALRAFDSDAVDYLVKPFDEERFQRAFAKALRIWRSSSAENMHDRRLEEIRRLADAFQKEEDKPTISIRDGARTFLVPLEDVTHIEASGNYVSFQTAERKFLHREPLQSLEKTLPANFIRIHKSVIVNTTYIREFQSLFNGDYLVRLKTGRELKLSRNFRDRIAHLL